MKAPKFWYDPHIFPWYIPGLWLLSLVWWLVGCCRNKLTKPYRAKIPVICVGNITIGGTGKTPTVLALSAYLKSHKLKVGLITRGYGRQETNIVQVNPAIHTAEQVGDEALLLAQVAPTWCGSDRGAVARVAESYDIDILIMDDGLQNASLYKDLSLIVIDASIGFGNQKVIPAGPCREPVVQALARSHAVILIGEAHKQILSQIIPYHLPILSARIQPNQNQLDGSFNNQKVIAFAGIGNPEKFFKTLVTCGANILHSYAFADHHSYTDKEFNTLVNEAKKLNALLVTTAKDFVRLAPSYQAQVKVLNVSLAFDDAALTQLNHLFSPLLGVLSP